MAYRGNKVTFLSAVGSPSSWHVKGCRLLSETFAPVYREGQIDDTAVGDLIRVADKRGKVQGFQQHVEEGFLQNLGAAPAGRDSRRRTTRSRLLSALGPGSVSLTPKPAWEWLRDVMTEAVGLAQAPSAGYLPAGGGEVIVTPDGTWYWDGAQWLQIGEA